jgi:hypothetical protein
LLNKPNRVDPTERTNKHIKNREVSIQLDPLIAPNNSTNRNSRLHRKDAKIAKKETADYAVITDGFFNNPRYPRDPRFIYFL